MFLATLLSQDSWILLLPATHLLPQPEGPPFCHWLFKISQILLQLCPFLQSSVVNVPGPWELEPESLTTKRPILLSLRTDLQGSDGKCLHSVLLI